MDTTKYQCSYWKNGLNNQSKANNYKQTKLLWNCKLRVEKVSDCNIASKKFDLAITKLWNLNAFLLPVLRRRHEKMLLCIFITCSLLSITSNISFLVIFWKCCFSSVFSAVLTGLKPSTNRSLFRTEWGFWSNTTPNHNNLIMIRERP